MTFYGTVAPPLCHSSKHSRFVSADAFGKSSYFRTGGRFTLDQPLTSVPHERLRSMSANSSASRTPSPIRRCPARIVSIRLCSLGLRSSGRRTRSTTTALVMEEAGQMASLR